MQGKCYANAVMCCYLGADNEKESADILCMLFFFFPSICGKWTVGAGGCETVEARVQPWALPSFLFLC